MDGGAQPSLMDLHDGKVHKLWTLAYCSQACLGRATAKPAPSITCTSGSTGTMSSKWEIGQKLVHRNGSAFTWRECSYSQEEAERMGWRAVDEAAKSTCSVVIAGVPCTLPEGHAFTNGHGMEKTNECGKDIGGMGAGIACNLPADHVPGECGWDWTRGPQRKPTKTALQDTLDKFDETTAIAPERKLAKGWTRASGYVCTKSASDRFFHDSWCSRPAVYKHEDHTGSGRNNLIACEAHAAEMGVFEQVRVVIDETTTFTEADWHKLTRIMQCKTCTHIHDIGKPCNGRSPFGEYSCPCGHERVEWKRETGDYERIGPAAGWMKVQDERSGATATLLANLERERVPGRRPIRTVRRYEGNGDE